MLSFISIVDKSWDFLLLSSIKSYYDIADEIILGIDNENKLWDNVKFDFDKNLFDKLIDSIDRDGKIKIVYGDFHSFSGEWSNETNERNLLSDLCKDGNWIIQINANEILLDKQEFKTSVMEANKNNLLEVEVVDIFKKLNELGENRYLCVDKKNETAPIATCVKNSYSFSRRTSQQSEKINTRILRYSYSMPTALETCKNIKSLKPDAAGDRWIQFWDSVNIDNHKSCGNLHPIDPKMWPRLVDIDIDKYISEKETFKRNGLWTTDEGKEYNLFDEAFSNALAQLISPPPRSTADLGCGKGFYCNFLTKAGWENVHGYEGMPNIWGIFDSITPIDLSAKQDLPKHELVISLEVGEHIPKEFEENFIYNLTNTAEKMLIISWAFPGQGGLGHFNEQPPEYVCKKMQEKGFELNVALTNTLRQKASFFWHKGGLFVFIRKQHE